MPRTPANLTGTWDGEYTYGDDYGPQRGESVPFRMSLTESGGGAVTGYVRDDAERGGMRERGRIAGKRESEALVFLKTVPSGGDGEAEAIEPLRRFFERELGLEIPLDLPPHRIRYAGVASPDGASVSGEWSIVPWRVEVEDGVIEYGAGSGTWTAKKVSPRVSAV